MGSNLKGKDDLSIPILGKATQVNPIELPEAQFISDKAQLPIDPIVYGEQKTKDQSFELAGPRKNIFFNPGKTKVGIVSCGGLCPGMNAVLRALVMELWNRYGCRQILGFCYGFKGLGKEASGSIVPLKPERVATIHQEGGTILGSSRGAANVSDMVDTLVNLDIKILFIIGGDGSMRGGLAIFEEVQKRKLPISIVGIPKTIDNDIPMVRRTFGFETAVEIACQALKSAFVEAQSYAMGVGLVKLMGRGAGFITASATLATSLPDFCLVPEVPFALEGEDGLFDLVEKKLNQEKPILIAVAEGAGQYFFANTTGEKDASGNQKLHDIGIYLKDQLGTHFKDKGIDLSLKYIDPSYMIRSAPANPADQLFCSRLAQNAVHGAMAGRSGFLVGYWHGVMTHVPLAILKHQSKTINPLGQLWFNVLETTGQPQNMGIHPTKESP